MARAGWYADPWGEAPLRWWSGEDWTAETTGPPPFFAPGELRRPRSALDDLLGDVERLAVVDVETTGLYNVDRVVEIAIVTLDRSGAVIDEFDTLVNPLRDVGPTWIHQVTASMVVDAPQFGDVAHHVAARLDGAVIVAHNLPFDRRMISNELKRCGIDLHWGTGLDTLAVTGCKLGVACEDFGIAVEAAHRALSDARATAELLLAVARSFETECSAATARGLAVTPLRVLTRDGHADVEAPAPYLARLARGVHTSVDLAPYADLLDTALADLRLTTDERFELAALAADLGLDSAAIERAHREFLDGLIDAALDDEVLTDDEYDQLCRAAALMSLDIEHVARRVDPYRTRSGSTELTAGLRVCFTGAAVDATGQPMERTVVEAFARSHDLDPVDSVTKKGCDLLVAADVATLSGKAATARRHGIPVASFDEFLTAIAECRPVSVAILASAGVPLVCVDCGNSWLAARRSRSPRCQTCRRATPASASRSVTRTDLAPTVETLTCVECGSTWERERVRGRKPQRCAACG